jgi:hypothetical protein
MKNFFIRITELFTTVSLAGVLIYFLFKFIIGSPEDLKNAHTQLNNLNTSIDTIKSSFDTLKTTNTFMLERMMAIEERQVDHTQKLDETEKITKKNNSELVQLRELYGKLIIPIRYNEVQIESDTSIMERYKLKK